MESERAEALRIDPVDQFSVGASWRVAESSDCTKKPPEGGF
ncbi:hypothetical protein [Aquimarina addita]